MTDTASQAKLQGPRDSYLTEFWHSAQPPWNTIGPELAANIRSMAEHSGPPPLTRWAEELRRARKNLGLSQAAVALGAGLCQTEVSSVERDKMGKNSRAWEHLAAFYGITLE